MNSETQTKEKIPRTPIGGPIHLEAWPRGSPRPIRVMFRSLGNTKEAALRKASFDGFR